MAIRQIQSSVLTFAPIRINSPHHLPWPRHFNCNKYINGCHSSNWPCHGSLRMRMIPPRASPYIIVHGDGIAMMSHHITLYMMYITPLWSYDQTRSASYVPFQGNSTPGFSPRACKCSWGKVKDIIKSNATFRWYLAAFPRSNSPNSVAKDCGSDELF